MKSVTLTLRALRACTTIGGFGKDVQGGREIVSDTASGAQREITN